MKPLKVLFLASEADPFIKIGGLGDVAGSLPNALMELGDTLDITLIIPFHNQLNIENFKIQPFHTFELHDQVPHQKVEVFSTTKEKLRVFFISGDPISSKERVYDPNIELDGEKYIFFDIAALEFVKSIGWRPDIVVANDWHTAIALHVIKHNELEKFWDGVKTILTIHNLCYMGAGTEASLKRYGITALVTDQIPWWGKHVPLPMGSFAADKIVTVSPTYSKEIQTAEYGCGLEDYFRFRNKDVVGIVNGIDQGSWNPITDPIIESNYSRSDLHKKAGNKEYLQRTFGLETDPNIPLLAMVTRMDQQKGVDLLIKAIELLSAEVFQVIILGTGNPEIEEDCKTLELRFPTKVRAVIKFDGKLSRKIYAGADMILMPSRYEPCGIAQMIAMRYGSVPIARKTGGLKDTISEGRTGFLFNNIVPSELAASISKAIETYQDKTAWQSIQLNGMSEDFSWKRSAIKYKNLFLEMVKGETNGI